MYNVKDDIVECGRNVMKVYFLLRIMCKDDGLKKVLYDDLVS